MENMFQHDFAFEVPPAPNLPLSTTQGPLKRKLDNRLAHGLSDKRIEATLDKVPLTSIDILDSCSKQKKKKVDLFKHFQQQVQSQNPPRLVSFKRKVSSSKYKGVLYVKSQSKWRAQVCLGGKKKYIGSYDSEMEAAVARDKKILQLFGDRPELLNFPQPSLDSTHGLFHNGAFSAHSYRTAASHLTSTRRQSQICFSQFPISTFMANQIGQEELNYGQNAPRNEQNIYLQQSFDNQSYHPSRGWFDRWQPPGVQNNMTLFENSSFESTGNYVQGQGQDHISANENISGTGGNTAHNTSQLKPRQQHEHTVDRTNGKKQQFDDRSYV